MRKFTYLFLFGAVFLLNACASTKNNGTAAQKVLLDDLVVTKQFEIVSDWAKPLTSNAFFQLANSGLFQPGNSATNISLIGNTNYLRFNQDSVTIELPFFGDRRRSGGYNADGGISFEGKYTDYQQEFKKDKNCYVLKFEVVKDTETLAFTIWLYLNLRSVIALNSSDRSFIDYDGAVHKLKTE